MKIEISSGMELDSKSIADDGTFEGYASLHDVVDSHADEVKSGAFAASLAARPASAVKMLRQHDQARPIGVWTDMVEDSRGLHVKGRLILDVPLAKETHLLMKAGALSGLSIGFRTKQSTFDRARGVRRLEAVDLREISIVTFPSLEGATVSSVKHAHDPERARSIVAALSRATAALRTN